MNKFKFVRLISLPSDSTKNLAPSVPILSLFKYLKSLINFIFLFIAYIKFKSKFVRLIRLLSDSAKNLAPLSPIQLELFKYLKRLINFVFLFYFLLKV